MENLPKGQARTVVAMSGGVDSSVAAALLAGEPGAGTVVGVTLRLMPKLQSSFGCCGSPKELDDARRVCEAVGIAHYTVDLSELFEAKVIAPFVQDYLEARTPNPCVECNRHVKFDYLLKLAEAWGAERLATGHYAKVALKDGAHRLYRAADRNKDQSYFLHPLTQAQLPHLAFPLGAMTKPEVRAKARELGLATADKPESQEICFVSSGDYRGFLESRSQGAATMQPGRVEDPFGKYIGEHLGVARYTAGQRKGLPATGERLFVLEAKPESNTLVVGNDEQARVSACKVRSCTWTVKAPEGVRQVQVQLRHRHVPIAAELSVTGELVTLRFENPERGVAPGQSAVFYDGDEVLGGGLIARL